MINIFKTLIISINCINLSYWHIDNLNLTVYNSHFLASEEALEKLIEDKQVQKINYLYVNYVESLYEDNYNQVGQYYVHLEIIILDEDNLYLPLTINVIEKSENDIELTWYQFLYILIKLILEKLISFFTW